MHSNYENFSLARMPHFMATGFEYIELDALQEDLRRGIPPQYADAAVSRLIELGCKPVHTLPVGFLEFHIENLAAGEFSFRPTSVNKGILAATLGTAPFKGDERIHLRISTNVPGIKVLPRFTGGNSFFYGTVSIEKCAAGRVTLLKDEFKIVYVPKSIWHTLQKEGIEFLRSMSV